MEELEKILKEEKLLIPGGVRKRNGDLTDFRPEKIYEAIYSAFEHNGGVDKEGIKNATIETIRILSKNKKRTPTVDEINETAINALNNLNHKNTAKCFEDYSKDRKNLRIMGAENGQGSTDSFLMVSSFSKDSYSEFTREKITESLINEANVDYRTAKSVSKKIQTAIIKSGVKEITTDLVRELAINEFWKTGNLDAINSYKSFSIPRSDLESIIGEKNAENSNIKANNPEAVNFTLAGILGKQYALSGGVFSEDIAKAHSEGSIHLHDLDMPTRVYCSAHSLEYLKKFGLNLENLQTSSSPAKHTETLTGHLNTFFAAMQAYYAGALGVGYFNIMYAPLIQKDLEEKGKRRINVMRNQLKELKSSSKGNKELEKILLSKEKELKEFEKDPFSILKDDEIDSFMKQRGQEAIYAASQNAFSRGGQTLFIDFNVHTGVPNYMKDTLAVLPGGKYGIKRNGKEVLLEEKHTGERSPSGYKLMELVDPESGETLMKESFEDGSSELRQEWNLKKGETPITYRNFDGVSKRFAKNLLEIWNKGDQNGQPFAFPKLDLHVSEETYEDPEQVDVLKQACDVSAHNGSTYFIFDRDEVSLAACCRLRTAIEDNYVIKHPESLRFCGVQNVTINLPQAAYRAAKKGKKSLEGFFEEIDSTLDLVVKAHLQKKEYIEKLQEPGLPQWQTKKECSDGQPYIDLDKGTYIVGMLGLNEAVQFLEGKELHELSSEESKNVALKSIAHLYTKVKEKGQEHGLKFSLEESPAESATRRMSKTDMKVFPEESRGLVKGDIEGDKTYYSNSIHPRADAPISLTERIELQGQYHPAIESGAITHCFVGEEKPSSESIYNLVKKTFDNTQTAQITISPEFTVCKSCQTTERGLQDECGNCGTDDGLRHLTRVVGYYSNIEDWNPSKQEERRGRGRGQYSVENSLESKVDIPKLSNPHKGITAITIGKDNCPLCDDLQQAMGYRQLVQSYGKDFNIVSYEANKEDGLVNAMVSNVNLSQLPALIILDENSNEIYRGQTTGMNGHTVPINPEEVEKSIKNYLEARK